MTRGEFYNCINTSKLVKSDKTNGTMEENVLGHGKEKQMKKKRVQRRIAWMLSILLVLGLFPTSVFAAEMNETEESKVESAQVELEEAETEITEDTENKETEDVTNQAVGGSEVAKPEEEISDEQQKKVNEEAAIGEGELISEDLFSGGYTDNMGISVQSTNLPSEIYLAQQGNTTCTLASSAMMLRSRFYKSNNNLWRSITESGIRSTAWIEGSGLRYSWTYKIENNSVSVSHNSVSGMSVNSLKELLNSHPEGIVLYCGKLPHAVFVTDYEGDTFFCADTIQAYSGKRIALSASYLGKKYGSQENILNNVTAYWYVSSYSIAGNGIVSETYDPIGAVDKIEGNLGSISVKGWAYDLDDVNASLEIHVYIGGDAGSGAECHVIKATEPSTDLSPIVGNHRFSNTIETSLEGDQPVYIYAVNIGGGKDVLIGSGNATITQKNITFEPASAESITSSNAVITAWGRNKGTMQELGFYFGMDGEYQSQSRIVVSRNIEWSDFCMKYDLNTYYGMLNPGQKYRYAFFCVKNGEEYKSDEATFVTSGNSGVTFDSLSISDVSSESAKIHGWGSNPNGYTLSSVGFEIGTGYTAEDKKIYEVWKEKSWTRPELTIDIAEHCGKLKPETNYVVRFYANIGTTRYYSDYMTFKTESDVVRFDEVNISDVSETNAVLSVWMNNSGTINEIGLYIGDSEHIQERIVYTGSDVTWTRANIIMDLNKYWKTLQPGQTYTYVFYAKKGDQEYRSKPGQFTTSGEKKIAFETVNVSQVSEDGAKIGVWFSNSQQAMITNIGVDIRTADYSEYASFEVTHNVSWTRAYLEHNIADYCNTLKPNTIYNVRYYIDINTERYYSEFSKFTTSQMDSSIIQKGNCGTNLKWTLRKDGVLNISGKGEMKNYTYKSEMPWYSYNNQIQTVNVENGVTSIGDYAFYGMPALKQITISKGVKTVGAYAFKNCTTLNNVQLPTTLKKLGESAFYGCSALERIDIPEGIYTVWAYTFKNCTSLEEVTLPSTLIKLDEAAFYGCASLEKIDIPDQVSIIGIYCFKNCSKLHTAKLPEALTGVREAAFYGTALMNVKLPERVQTIGDYAFKNCANLTSVHLPDTLTSVGEASFYACTSLQSMTVPDQVTSIGAYAFRRCTGLKEVTFGAALTEIGESAFYGCSGLESLNLVHVTKIGDYAFKACSGVTQVDLGEVEVIGDSAFHSCTGLQNIVFPESVASIGNYCFSGSSSLNLLQFMGEAPVIGTSAFNGLTAEAVYPAEKESWTADVMQNYGGKLTWTVLQEDSDTVDAEPEEKVSEDDLSEKNDPKQKEETGDTKENPELPETEITPEEPAGENTSEKTDSEESGLEENASEEKTDEAEITEEEQNLDTEAAVSTSVEEAIEEMMEETTVESEE